MKWRFMKVLRNEKLEEMTFLSENIKSLQCRKVLSVDGKSIEGRGRKRKVLGEVGGESRRQKVKVETQALKVKLKLFTERKSYIIVFLYLLLSLLRISLHKVHHDILECCHDR
jgi:hypothetical protein